MKYLLFTEEEMKAICGSYSEGTITREIIMGIKTKQGMYALDASLLDSDSSELVYRISHKLPVSLDESDLIEINIR